MLFRFCLYGFLKNQQYYEPFLILAFLDKGLSFAMIGLLIGFREICINLLEIPTGAIADVLGRRRAMIASFVGYIAAFLIFTVAGAYYLLFGAMFLFAIGEAFRTGTHKAIIFAWLSHEGRASEKTAVYGVTRSWAKIGSAVSVVVASTIVFITQDYRAIFILCIIPYLVNIINFIGYPKYLDGERSEAPAVKTVCSTLTGCLKSTVKSPNLRRLLTESMSYEGIAKTSLDYLQPALKATAKTAALALPVAAALESRQRTALLVGLIYFVLYMLSSVASRKAGRFSEWAGGEEKSARRLWFITLGAFAVMTAAFGVHLMPVIIGCFVVLAIVHNLWRPVMVSRISAHANPAQTATILSVDSQAKSLFMAVSAPVVGFAVDRTAAYSEDLRLLPVAVFGLVLCSAALLLARSSAAEAPAE